MPLQGDQLSRMTIRGFKSIKSCDLSFGKINVLIGSNGAGKSNFISAFSFLQNILSKNLQVSVGQSGLSSLLYNGRKVTEEIDFEVFFGQNSYGFVLVPTDDNRLIFQKEYFGYHGGWDNESNIGRGHSESQWENGAHNGIDDYVVPTLRKQNWRVYHFHDTGKGARVKQEHNISNNKMLLYDAANLAAFLYRLKNFFKQNYDEIVETIRLVAPYFDDFVLEPDGRYLSLRWKQKNSDVLFEAFDFSYGTIRFIALATLLMTPLNMMPDTILIDEPELGLHPLALKILAEMMQAAARQGKQVIATTQSVTLINQFAPEDIIVADRKDSQSVFRRLDEKEIKDWLDEYALGEIWEKDIIGGTPDEF